MAQSLQIKIKGLFTSVNELSEVPEGALLVADNIDISKDSIAEPRRGFDRLRDGSNASLGFTTSTDRAARTFFYQDKQLAHHGTLGSENTLSWRDTNAWTSLGTFSAPSGFKMRELMAAQNLLFTSSAGVYKLDAYNGTPRLSGAVKALDVTTSVSSTSSSAWLAENESTAWRVVWGYEDANGNQIVGAPSPRAVMTNSYSIPVYPTLRIAIPSGVTTSWFFQIYRAETVASSSEPSDEMGLVYQASPDSTAISNGYIDVTDITPDELRGQTLYTSASQEGLGYGNERPPLAADLATFGGVTFYGNTVSKHRYYLTVLAVGGSSGVVKDDTITIGGVAYTAKFSEAIASAQFKAYYSFTFVDADVNTGTDVITKAGHTLQTGDAVTLTSTGTLPAGLALATTYYAGSVTASTFKLYPDPLLAGTAIDITAAAGGGTHTVSLGSVSQNIRDTATSLVRVINRHASSTVYAFYISGVDDTPGMILLEERAIGGASFAVTSSRATWTSPALPTSGTTESSINDTYENGLAWSKPDLPEAVPLPNFKQVGRRDSAILRLIALEEALYIFKDEGIYRLTGTYPTYSPELLDNSAKLLAPEACVVLNNQIFALTDQGVVVVSDGVRVISRPIEDDLRELFDSDLDGVRDLSWAVAYETERKFILFTLVTAGDTYAQQAFVYNVFTNTWVRHVLASTAGVVFENHLYLADAASQYMLRDRKSNTYLDYADFLATSTITAASGTTITLGSNVDLLSVGDLVYQSSTKFAIITAIDTITSEVTVTSNPGFTVAACELLSGISVEIQWAPITSGNPGVLKQYHTAIPLFKADFLGTAYLDFKTDLSPAIESVPITGSTVGAWGLFGWGSSPWGGAPRKRPVRQWVPRAKQRGSMLTVGFRHAYGFSAWQLQGLSVVGPTSGERVMR